MSDQNKPRIFKAVIGTVGVNKNGRLISEETWRKALENMGEHVLGTFADDSYLSSLNYEPNVMNSCTELRSYEIGEDGCVYADFEIIDTPYGRLLSRLLDAEPNTRVKSTPIAIGLIDNDTITDLNILGFGLELMQSPEDSKGDK